MTGETLKQFLVGLSFGVDDASLAKFNKSIAQATVRVTALYAATKIAAAGIFYSISKASEGFEEMGRQFHLIAPAINKELYLRRELLLAYSRAGVNLQKVVQQSVKFNLSLAKTGIALKAIYGSVAAKFFPLLTKQMDVFRDKIYANMPKIQRTLEAFVFFIFKAFDATVILGNRIWSILSRIYDFFVMLDHATNGWSTIILGVIAAWKLLNLEFLKTPLGMLITSLGILIGLWDDFQTYMEGGESLLNWGDRSVRIFGALAAVLASIIPLVYATKAAFSVLADIMKVVNGVLSIYNGVVKVMTFIMSLNPVTLWVLGFLALIAVIGLVIWKWDFLKKKMTEFIDWAKNIDLGAVFNKLLSGAGSLISGIAGAGGNIAGAVGNFLGSETYPPSLGGNATNNKQNNVNVNTQTNINVQGTPDASATGRAAAGEQSKVNFNLIQNLMPKVQ